MGREIFLIVFFVLVLLGTIVIVRICMEIFGSIKAWMNHVADDFDGIILVYFPRRKKVEFLSDSVGWKFDIERERVCRDVKYLFEALDISPGDEIVRNFCEGGYPLSEQKDYTVTGARKQGLYRVRVKTTPCGRGRYLLTIADRTADYVRAETLNTVVRVLEYENQRQLFQKVFDEMSGILQKPGDIFALAVKQLCTRLTEFVRADQPLAREVFSLRDLIWEIIDQLSHQTKASGQKLELNVSILDEMVVGDAEMLRLVMWNILKNAVIYTPKDGTIVFTVIEDVKQEKESDTVSLVIAVEDNGAGIGEEFMPKLFQPLQRAEDPAVRKMNGYGLGLATVKKIVDSMGGRIEVKSEKGKGTRFAVSMEIELAEEDEMK